MKYTKTLKKIINFFNVLCKILYVVMCIGLVSYAIIGIFTATSLISKGAFDSIESFENAKVPYIDITVANYIVLTATVIGGFFVTRYAKKYFSYAKENSPFSAKASKILEDYTKSIVIFTFAIFAIDVATQLGKNFGLSNLVGTIVSLGIKCLLLYAFVYITKRFEKLDEHDVYEIKDLFTRAESACKALILCFAVYAVLGIVAAVSFSITEASVPSIILTILGVSSNENFVYFLLSSATYSACLTVSFVLLSGYFKSVNGEGTIFDEKCQSTLKKSGILNIVLPLLITIVAEITLTSILNDESLDISVIDCIFMGIAMLLLRIVIYSKKEQLEFNERKDSADTPYFDSKNNDNNSPFLS